MDGAETSDRFVVPPGKITTDVLWYMIIGVFVLVFLISVVTVLAGFFTSGWTKSEPSPVVPSDAVYAVFTLIAGGLAGLVAPSPITKRVRENSSGVRVLSQTGANVAWLGITGVLAVILFAVTVVLVIGFFTAGPNDSFSVGIDKLTELATAAFGYLVGLLSPSPVADRN